MQLSLFLYYFILQLPFTISALQVKRASSDNPTTLTWPAPFSYEKEDCPFYWGDRCPQGDNYPKPDWAPKIKTFQYVYLNYVQDREDLYEVMIEFELYTDNLPAGDLVSITFNNLRTPEDYIPNPQSALANWLDASESVSSSPYHFFVKWVMQAEYNGYQLCTTPFSIKYSWTPQIPSFKRALAVPNAVVEYVHDCYGEYPIQCWDQICGKKVNAEPSTITSTLANLPQPTDCPDSYEPMMCNYQGSGDGLEIFRFVSVHHISDLLYEVTIEFQLKDSLYPVRDLQEITIDQLTTPGNYLPNLQLYGNGMDPVGDSPYHWFFTFVMEAEDMGNFVCATPFSIYYQWSGFSKTYIHSCGELLDGIYDLPLQCWENTCVKPLQETTTESEKESSTEPIEIELTESSEETSTEETSTENEEDESFTEPEKDYSTKLQSESSTESGEGTFTESNQDSSSSEDFSDPSSEIITESWFEQVSTPYPTSELTAISSEPGTDISFSNIPTQLPFPIESPIVHPENPIESNSEDLTDPNTNEPTDPMTREPMDPGADDPIEYITEESTVTPTYEHSYPSTGETNILSTDENSYPPTEEQTDESTIPPTTDMSQPETKTTEEPSITYNTNQTGTEEPTSLVSKGLSETYSEDPPELHSESSTVLPTEEPTLSENPTIPILGEVTFTVIQSSDQPPPPSIETVTEANAETNINPTIRTFPESFTSVNSDPPPVTITLTEIITTTSIDPSNPNVSETLILTVITTSIDVPQVVVTTTVSRPDTTYVTTITEPYNPPVIVTTTVSESDSSYVTTITEPYNPPVTVTVSNPDTTYVTTVTNPYYPPPTVTTIVNPDTTYVVTVTPPYVPPGVVTTITNPYTTYVTTGPYNPPVVVTTIVYPDTTLVATVTGPYVPPPFVTTVTGANTVYVTTISYPPVYPPVPTGSQPGGTTPGNVNLEQGEELQTPPSGGNSYAPANSNDSSANLEQNEELQVQYPDANTNSPSSSNTSQGAPNVPANFNPTEDVSRPENPNDPTTNSNQTEELQAPVSGDDPNSTENANAPVGNPNDPSLQNDEELIQDTKVFSYTSAVSTTIVSHGTTYETSIPVIYTTTVPQNEIPDGIPEVLVATANPTSPDYDDTSNANPDLEELLEGFEGLASDISINTFMLCLCLISTIIFV
ncbi:uncharacterized protein SPAPADRAFT_66046 [Spathaspora passalidarum NRRL Y-27907]|uniref:Flo11 domain-containing protein n=1 Tax=Spathaspora passalidarum (strain NRRL Y-27907 / 11-Y1) TaxID=619300 RepID=G3AKZ1_SPAPN|nr:uncharacterized protein SPAPADRAFT_66046 [Spathaspora passalidarum NRRL Y-27907]EGW33034.1 hypothetical protein SPAPADRAFT_66046 [Spathaspora passalidarum NRRL Y-27907]